MRKERKTEIIEGAEISIKYEGYIDRQMDQIEKFKAQEQWIIPDSFDYSDITALSAEGREKLTKIRPHSLGQASRISGVTPADISILSIHLKRGSAA